MIIRKVDTGCIPPLYYAAAFTTITAAAMLISPLCGALAQAPSAGAPTTAMPAVGPAQPLRLPPIGQRQLPNGLKLVILEDHRQPAVWLRLAIGGGSSRDPHDRAGLAQMTANLLDKGTTNRTETQIADQVDSLGANLGAGSDLDYLTVSASGLSSHTDTLFDLLSDISLHPTFPAQELERARTRTLSGITSSLGQPATVADAAIHRRVYGPHPYGNFTSGTPATVRAIAQTDLVQFHKQLFVPNNATLFVVGDITVEQALAKAQARFGEWQRRDLTPGPAAPSAGAPSSAGPQITIVDRPGAAQTEVRVGLLTPGYNDPKRPISRVASAVLGLGQFEGRLTREIRVKRGLTYGAASFFDRKGQAGIFEISTFTKNQSTGEVLKIALDEVRRLQSEATPSDELQERKEFLNGSFAVSVATTPGVLQRLIPAVLYGAGPEELTRYTGDVASVTSAQIEEFMKSLPLDRLQIVLVGDASAIEPQVKSIGTVTTIPAGSLDLQSPSLRSTETKPADGGGTPPTADSAAEGKKRLAASIQALGGDAFLNLKAFTLKGDGEITPPGTDMKLPIAAATLTFAPPGRSRFELNTTFGDVIFGSDGSGKSWLSALGAVQDGPAGFGDPTDLLRRGMQKDYAVALLPDLKDPAGAGAPLQGFSLTDENKHVAKIYVDAQTHLPRQVSTQSGQGTLDLLLGEYHATNKVSLPGSLKVTQDGKAFVSLKFTSWEINKPIDEKLFQRPK